MKTKTLLITFLCAALTLICSTSFGAGGGGSNTGGGTIYYVHTGLKTTWTMNSDGSNQTQLGFGTYGPVSTVCHNNHRWFLDRGKSYLESTIQTESTESKSSRTATTTTSTSTTTALQGYSSPTTSRFKPTRMGSTRCTGYPEAR
jgi:hypothetical protein